MLTYLLPFFFNMIGMCIIYCTCINDYVVQTIYQDFSEYIDTV